MNANLPSTPDRTSSHTETPSSRSGILYDRRSLIACLAGTFILRMAASIVGSTIQLYFGYIDQNVYPVSDTARGLALAVFFLPELIGSPVLGAWSDRLGNKWFMLLGAVFGGIGVQLTAMTTNLAAIIIMRLLGGLSTASAIPATLSYLSGITAHSESLRGRAMGWFQIATLGGTILGILIGGRLWDQFHQGAFTLDGLVYLVSLLIFAIGIRHARPTSAPDRAKVAVTRGRQAIAAQWKHYRALLTSPVVLRFAPAFLAINMVLGVWMNHIVGQLVAADHRFPNQLLYGLLADNRSAGTDISLYGTAILGLFGLGALVWSFGIGRFRRTTVMLVNTGALFALCAAMFELNHAGLDSPATPFLLAVAVASLLVLSGMMPAALTFLADLSEAESADRGAIMGLYTIFFGLGGFLGTLLGGPFADWNGIDGILLLTAVLGLVATTLLLRLRSSEPSTTV